MKIQRLELQDFRCFPELALTFEPGLNIISGPNGAGKSTIQRAMLKILFDRPSRSQANAADQAWGAEQLYTLAMDFEDHIGQNWTVSKNFQTNRARLEGENGESWAAAASVQQELARCIGTDSSKLFASTLFVAQSELASIQQGQQDISLGLEERVTGGESGVNTTALLKQLDTAITDYRRGYETTAYKNPGPIAALTQQEKELEARVGELRQRAATLETLEARRETIEQRLAEIESELTPSQELLQQLAFVHDIQEELARAQAEEARLEARIQEINQAQDAIVEAKHAVAQLGTLADVDESREQEIKRLLTQIDYLQTASIPQPRATTISWFGRFWLPLLLIVLSVIVLAVVVGLATQAVLTVQGTVVGLAASGILLIIGAGLWGSIEIRSRREAKRNRDAYAFAVQQRQEEIQQAQATLQGQLSALGCRSVQEYGNKMKQRAEAVEQRKHAEIRLQTLLGANRSQEVWEQERQAASLKRRDCEEQLSGPKLASAAKMSALEQGQLQRKVKEMSQEQEHLQDEAQQLRFQIQQVAMEPEELLAAEERLAHVREDLARRIHAFEVYKYTREMLDQARQQTVERVRAKLEQAASTYFRQLTHGHYEQIALENSLDILVAIPEHGELTVKPDQLSCGTQDQLYFAVRLALVDLLFDTTRPPIFLDDPFVTFDPSRQHAALEICQQISETRQVFLFTCVDHYSGWGNEIQLDPVEMHSPYLARSSGFPSSSQR